MQQRGDNRGVNTAGQTQQYVTVAHLLADTGDLIINNSGGGPQRFALADLQRKVLHHALALQRVRDFRVKLNAVQLFRFVRHTCDGARRC